jgi:hypothetical protein
MHGPMYIKKKVPRVLSPGAKYPGRENYYLPPSHAEVKNALSCTSTPPVCPYSVDGYNFILLLLYKTYRLLPCPQQQTTAPCPEPDIFSPHQPPYFFNKGKAVTLQAWSGPEGCRKLRFPDFMTMVQDGGKVVSFTHRPPLPAENAPGTRFC